MGASEKLLSELSAGFQRRVREVGEHAVNAHAEHLLVFAQRIVLIFGGERRKGVAAGETGDVDDAPDVVPTR